MPTVYQNQYKPHEKIRMLSGFVMIVEIAVYRGNGRNNHQFLWFPEEEQISSNFYAKRRFRLRSKLLLACKSCTTHERINLINNLRFQQNLKNLQRIFQLTGLPNVVFNVLILNRIFFNTTSFHLEAFFWKNALMTSVLVNYKRVLFSFFPEYQLSVMARASLLCRNNYCPHCAQTKGLLAQILRFAFQSFAFVLPASFLLFSHAQKNVENTCS